jgi:tight adherence protein C
MISGGQNLVEIFRPDGAGMFAAVFLTFLAAFFFVLGYMDILRRRADIKRRAILDRNMSSQGNLLDSDWFNSSRSLRYQSLSQTSALLGDVERRSKEKETESSQIRRDLSKAGYFGQNAVVWYQSIRLSLFAAFMTIGIIIAYILFPSFSSGTKVMIVGSLAALGFLLPSRYIRRRQKQIIEECRNGFPDFVDLMVISAEAGLSPRAAIDRLSREIAETYPYLGANLYLTNLEVRAGISIHEALFNLGKRTQVKESSTLASLLQQTEQLGTSITDALRIYSDEMRERRLIRAEERAHSLPVKLVLPLGLFVFPVILVVILLPVIIRMKNALS